MSDVRKSIKSPKGTDLPLMNLKGKEYLAVAHRLVLFREANPTGIIKTTMIERQGEGPDEYAVFKAEIFVESERGPMMIANGHKRESRKDFADFVEKCETSAVGRALTLAGYGLQFVGDELNEGMRLADAPLEVVVKATSSTSTPEMDTSNPSGTTTGARKSSFRKNVSASVSTGDDI
jgi:hypothetical protein